MRNAVLESMPSGVRAALEPELKAVEFGHGHVFYKRGDLIETIHFPVDGVISVVTELTDGTSVETATVGRDGAVGLASALAPVKAHGLTIGQAPGMVLSAPTENLRRLAAESAPLRQLCVCYGDVLLAQAQQSVACNVLHDVEERFCRWLLMCDDRVVGGRVDLTQEFLAMMLGVQRTTISQVAGGLQAAGLIRYSRGRIDILDRAGLMLRGCECYETVRRLMREALPASVETLTPTSHRDEATLR